MEKIVFRSYLNFAKKEDIKLWRSLTKMPLKLKILFVTAFLLDFLFLINVFKQDFSNIISWIFILISAVIIIVLFFQVEIYIIERSEESYNEYKNYCMKLKKWLFENWISSEDEIKTIINRMKAIIDNEKTKREKYSSKVFSLFQILVVPIILLTVTSYVNNERDFVTAFANIIGVSFVIITIFAYLGLIWNAFSSVKVKKVAQMERFVDDLQSVLDVCFYNIYKGKEQKMIQSEINEEMEKTKE